MNILILGPENRNQAVADFLRGQGNDVQFRTDPVDVTHLHDMGAEFLISNGYAPIVKPPVIDAYRGRVINMHPAILPWGRGIFPVVWALLLGHPTGVTIHFIDEGIDTGNILCEKRIPPLSGETLEKFYARLLKETEALFFENWNAIQTGALKAAAQAENDSRRHYHDRTSSEQLIDLLPAIWDTPVETVQMLGAEITLSERFWSECLGDA